MSTRATEFQQDALEMLQRLGVRNAQVGVDGSFPVTTGKIELISHETVEATNPLNRFFNSTPYPDEVVQIVRPTANNPLCDLLPCELLGVLGIECCEERTEWQDPSLLVDAIPVRIPAATVYLNPFNARVEGDIRLRGQNGSEPGLRCTRVECKCEPTPTWFCEEVDGSATVSGDDQHRVVADAIDELIDTVSSQFSGLRPEASVTREASFTKSGALSVIESILDLLISGTIRVQADVNVTAGVTWRGRTLTKQFRTSAVVRLPVDNVNYRW